MKAANLTLAGCLLFPALGGAAIPSHAFELSGAWTTDSGVCPKLFAKTAKAISFQRDSEEHGSGFIVDGNVIRGPRTKCTIKSKKENGPQTTLIAICATDIMIDEVQLNFKVLDDNKIVRLFPKMESFEMTYVRCPL